MVGHVEVGHAEVLLWGWPGWAAAPSWQCAWTAGCCSRAGLTAAPSWQRAYMQLTACIHTCCGMLSTAPLNLRTGSLLRAGGGLPRLHPHA